MNEEAIIYLKLCGWMVETRNNSCSYQTYSVFIDPITNKQYGNIAIVYWIQQYRDGRDLKEIPVSFHEAVKKGI